MGLDASEIIMQTEEVFGVDLPDEDCRRVRTVNDLYWLVLDRLKLPYLAPHEIEEASWGRSRFKSWLGGASRWDAPDVWRTLKAIIEDRLEIDPGAIVPNARFLEDLGCH